MIMAKSFLKSVLKNLFLIWFFFIKSLASFKFPETIISETGVEIFVPELDENQSCIPLKDCPPLSWLAREISSEKLSQMLSSQDIKSKRCVISEVDTEEEVTMETRVVCPKIHDKSVAKNEKDCGDDCEWTEDDYEIRTVFELERNTAIECSIQLQHGEVDDPLNDLQIKSLSGKRKKYRHLKRLAERRVIRVTADGFCCWRVYQRKGFKGESTYIEPNDETFPDHLVMSTELVECED